VPDLSNLTYEQAEQALQPVQLRLARAGERFDPSVPKGFVLSQDPPPDTPVREHRKVSVMVSLGEEFSSVPELFGSSLRGARLMVERAGLRVGTITRAPSEEVGEGMVVASDPPAEAVLPHDAAIGVLLSTGPGPETYVVPELLGRDVAAVKDQLEGMGFRVIIPTRAVRGVVFFQDPAPGSRIARGGTILLQAAGPVSR
jgi:serine/threonine-protein kinase